MGTLLQDLRYGLRMLAKNPGFTVVAVVTLALGIGANTAIFSLLNALLLRPIPVRHPERLVRIGSVDNQGRINVVPGPLLDRLRDEPLLDGICGVQTPLTTVQVKQTPFPAGGLAASGDCYKTLGVRPAIGRLFNRADDIPNGPRVTVLMYEFWQRQFAGDPNVLGQSIRIEGVPFTIIGVTEPRFRGLLLGYPVNLSFPISQQVNPRFGDTHEAHVFYWAFGFGRLKPGVTPERVRARLSVEWRRLLDESLPARFQGIERQELLKRPIGLASGGDGLDFGLLRDRFRQPLLGLLALSGLVLLLSCINVANLLLARGLQRQREIAVRLALGASRSHIIRQLVAESGLLMTAGIASALFLAHAADRILLASFSQANTGFEMTASPDLRVLLFTSGVAVAALLLVGLLPARQISDVGLTDALKSTSRSVSRAQSRSRRILISVQVALTLVLVMAAGLFIETLRHLRDERLGFSVEGVLNAQLIPLPGGYAQGFTPAVYYRDLLGRMQSLPGVEAASLSHFSPLFSMPKRDYVRPVGALDMYAAQATDELVSDGFLATMRIPLLQGRDFSRSDTLGSQKTAIVSESLARRLFPAGWAIGQHIRVGSENEMQDAEIIGVAADARLLDPRVKDFSFLYLNYWQRSDRQEWGDLQLRYSGNPALLTSAVRHELQEAGHEYAFRIRSIAQQRDISLMKEKLLAMLGSAFGVLALMLAAVGLFGLLSFLVTSRTSELGLRVALGAKRRNLIWLVVRETLALVGAGLLIGLPLSYASVRVLSGLLYGVGAFPTGPLLFSAVILLAVAALATVIPVHRATSVDPMVALRYE